MKLNLHLLRVFFEVAEQRSFSRAAETLRISQPAVSKAVRELEHQLDLPLIERITRVKGIKGLHLTENGQALFDHARGIFALERSAVEDIRARVGLKRGALKLGASTTIAGYWLPIYLAAFRKKYSSVELCVQVGNTQAMKQSLIDCEIDLALVEGPVMDSRIKTDLWRDEEVKIITYPNAAISSWGEFNADEFSRQVWLVREPGSGTRDATEKMMGTLGIHPQRRIEFGSNEGIARAVAAGAGFAMLPLPVVRELIMLKEVHVLEFPETSLLIRPLFLLQLKERPSSPPMRAFCEILNQTHTSL